MAGGPAAALAYFSQRWLLGVLLQNLISFAGDQDCRDVILMILKPFLTNQFDGGWFVRSQHQTGITGRADLRHRRAQADDAA